MLNLRTIFLFLIILLSIQIYAQDEFKPSGTPTARVFTDFKYDLGENQSGFELFRAYFGYNYNLSPFYTANILFDVGSPEIDINDSTTVSSTYNFTAFLKAASLSYKKDDLKVDIGMIGLQQMKIQEQYWGHRYIYKSFQDWSKMGTTADLGAIISYRFADFLSADFTLRNGEGYKVIENDNAFRSALGVTISPFIKGLVFRGFYDYIEKQESMFTIAHFLGYQNDKLSTGAEYNIQLNNNDKVDHNLSGISVYGSYKFTDKAEVFLRYDNLSSNTINGEDDNWNITKDGNLFIGGIQYSPLKNIQFAIDYQGFVPSEEESDMISQIYFHVQFNY